MSCQEDQEEEIEVLESIYDGDECFKAVNKTTYQYKIGEDGAYKSFVIEVQWGEEYPQEMPNISMDAFYNKHILPEVKTKVVEALTEQCDMLLGCAMTYTLFEYVKENAEELTADQPDSPPQVQEERSETPAQKDEKKQKDKKEHMTKSQKRRMFDKLNTQGEMPRGWNWVDIVKHLSQTGRGQKDES